MKSINIILLVVVCIALFSSCRKQRVARNGAATIEILSLSKGQDVSGNGEEKVKVKFCTKLNRSCLGGYSVLLKTSNLTRQELENGASIEGILHPGERVILQENDMLTDQNLKEFIFERDIDLSAIADGQSLVLIVGVSPIVRGLELVGEEVGAIYFFKNNM